MGLRVRLKASVDISGFPRQARVLLTALKRYGMILADNGSPWYVTGAPDPHWNDDDLHDLHQISRIRLRGRGHQLPAQRLTGGHRPGPGPSAVVEAQHVAHAADRLQEPRVRRVILDVAAQPVDVDVDRARLAGVVVAPDTLQQLVAREHLARVAQQEREQLERLRLDRRSATPPRINRWPARSTVTAPRRTSDVARGAAATTSCRRRCARTRAWSSRRLNGLVT